MIRVSSITEVKQHCPGGDGFVEPVRRFLRQPESFLADSEHKLGEAFLPDATNDPLGIHLAKTKNKDGSALGVVVMPSAREVVLDHGRIL